MEAADEITKSGFAGRMLSLDVFRGLTIAGMVLVNNPGTWGSIYWPLEHAEWNGWTFTDTVFPFFVWISGLAMTLSFAKRMEEGLVPLATSWSLVGWRVAMRARDGPSLGP